jgi:hypothetical protein
LSFLAILFNFSSKPLIYNGNAVDTTYSNLITPSAIFSTLIIFIPPTSLLFFTWVPKHAYASQFGISTTLIIGVIGTPP